MMRSGGLCLWTATLVGIGLGVGIGCDRAAPGGGAAATAAKPSTAPATQPGPADLSAIQRMVSDSSASSGGNTGLPMLPPKHPPVPGVSMPAPAQSPNLPAGHPPLSAMTDTPPAPRKTEPGIPLKWDEPTDWKPARPASTFRLAQYEVPATEGDGPGEVAVFHFTGSGGSVEDNVARWIAQFSDANGKAIDSAALKQETFEANGLKVHFVEVSGYMLVSRTMGGTGERSPSLYRLLGAIVEMPDGNWFFKGTGPDHTMSAAREAFLRLLRSVHRGEAASAQQGDATTAHEDKATAAHEGDANTTQEDKATARQGESPAAPNTP